MLQYISLYETLPSFAEKEFLKWVKTSKAKNVAKESVRERTGAIITTTNDPYLMNYNEQSRVFIAENRTGFMH